MKRFAASVARLGVYTTVCASLAHVATAPDPIERGVEVAGAIEIAAVENVSLLSGLLDDRPASLVPPGTTTTTSAAPDPVVEQSVTEQISPGSAGVRDRVAEADTAQTDPVDEAVPGALADDDETTEVAEAQTAPRPEQLGRMAIASMDFDFAARFPHWTIEFLDGRRGTRALTHTRENRIEVFVRGSDTVETLHRVIAHEIGHVIDIELNSPADRRRWRQQRGLADSVQWWPGESAPDFETGAGDFAEAFAVLETGIRSEATVAGQPDTGDLELLIELAS